MDKRGRPRVYHGLGDGHTKRCTRCKLSKPESEFSRNCSSPDGLRYQCKDCDHKKYIDRKSGIKPCPPALRKAKKCNKCFIIKMLHDFHSNKKSPDGHAYSCIECHKAERESTKLVYNNDTYPDTFLPIKEAATRKLIVLYEQRFECLYNNKLTIHSPADEALECLERNGL